jgi:asparagine synthetase B (glutamine-hydrolysing)
MTCAHPAPRPYQLDAFEVLTGFVGGTDPLVPRLRPDVHQGRTPLEALEAAIVPALARPPCLVIFSGGRDSSAVLAVAAAVARREGLLQPVPATNRFPGVAESEEQHWQELVVRHLGLADWHIVDLEDELDLVGPFARSALAKWGPVFPINAHFAMALMEAAPGGSALTGAGGDQIFMAGTDLRVARLLTLEDKPRRADWRLLASRLLPPAHWRRRAAHVAATLPWLTDQAKVRLAEALGELYAPGPLWYSTTLLRTLWADRSRAAFEKTLNALANPLDILMVHPLQAPSFVASMAAAKPRTGYRNRDAAMVDLFSGLLPDELLVRQTKASFNRALFHNHSREFARSWDGTGLDQDLADIDQLRLAWEADVVDARSFSALQAAWAAVHSRSGS